MKDALIIFIILLVLLILISTLGGTIRQEPFAQSASTHKPTAPGPHMSKELFEASAIVTAPAAVASVPTPTPIPTVPAPVAFPDEMSGSAVEPSGYSADMDFASVMAGNTTQEEALPTGLPPIASFEGFTNRKPRNDMLTVEPYDGACQYATVK